MARELSDQTEQVQRWQARAVTRMVLQNGVESAGECDASQDGDGEDQPHQPEEQGVCRDEIKEWRAP